MVELCEEHIRLTTCLEDLYEKMWMERVSYITTMQTLEDQVYYTLQKIKGIDRRMYEAQKLLRESGDTHSPQD